jgi:hypothetical protein
LHKYDPAAEWGGLNVHPARSRLKAMDELLEVIEANEWRRDEGLVALLTTGMAYLKAERALSVSQGAAGLSEAEIEKLLDRLVVIEARYAAIKNCAFDIMRDHRILEIKFVPIEQEYRSFKRMVWILRNENDALKAENERLRRELQARVPAADEPPAPRQRRFWPRLWDVLRGRSDNAQEFCWIGSSEIEITEHRCPGQGRNIVDQP